MRRCDLDLDRDTERGVLDRLRERVFETERRGDLVWPRLTDRSRGVLSRLVGVLDRERRSRVSRSRLRLREAPRL